MEKAKKFIDKVAERLLVILMGVLTLDVLWQVISRYVMTNPSSWTEELARYLLIWVAILGAAYVTGQKGHISIDLISTRISPAQNRRLTVFIRIMIMLFAIFIMVVGGGNLIHITLTNGQASPAMGIPLGYIYCIIPISGLLIVFYTLVHILNPSSNS